MSYSVQDFAAATGLPEIILASRSPRRRLLLESIGMTFRIVVPEVDESVRAGEHPRDYVARLSRSKALSLKAEELPVLAADTTVVLDDLILGKPESTKEAISLLRLLSNRTHTVLTAFSLVDRSIDFQITEVSSTAVSFRALDDDEIAAYVETGAPFDKAGGYGIQDDIGQLFVDRIEGDYPTVVGLPIGRVYRAMRQLTLLRST